MKPVHQHDCDKCIYLGSVYEFTAGKKDPQLIDTYWCGQQNHYLQGSILGRYGDAGPEYASSLPPHCFGGGATPAENMEQFLAMQSGWYHYALLKATWMGLYKKPRFKETV